MSHHLQSYSLHDFFLTGGVCRVYIQAYKDVTPPIPIYRDPSFQYDTYQDITTEYDFLSQAWGGYRRLAIWQWWLDHEQYAFCVDDEGSVLLRKESDLF